MARRKRVLIVARNLPPYWGGMERLNWHIAEELSREAEVRIVGPSGSAACAPAAVAVSEIPLKPLPWFLLKSMWRALQLAQKWQPDIVLAGSGLTAPLCWIAARVCGASSVVYVHGLDVAVSHPIYRAIWFPTLRRMDRVVANSRATAALAAELGIRAARISIIHPGSDISSRSPDVAAAGIFRSRSDIRDRPLLLSVGRLTRRKGLREFVSDVLPKIVARRPEVLLVIVGDAPTHSLHAEVQTRQSIQDAADAAGVGANILFLGVITDQQRLDEVYRSADLHVFPVREIPGDPEGFGMVALEAAARGVPTVAYSTGGIPDAVADGVSGVLVQPGDHERFAAEVVRLMADPAADEFRRTTYQFARQFGWGEFGAKLRATILER
ncbi:glycosyltransferase family 4 protein [Solimonas terrae]|uniref:Glycosyltransferase family 4 protein n=1 Tax=Solimonas terrae TaxID=1396819 RepID=A0A6M2BXQ4_9GAMM|nr:glycosyltransferase family 4 protein [Solimonas terrae]NGY06961.1 glycosyltransferase family 4 protein [Solimonas terrae]